MFYNEAQQIARISQLTNDIEGFLTSLHEKTAPEFVTDTLRRPATDWLERIRSRQLSENDRLSATQGFLNALRLMVRNDVTVAKAQMRYTFFRDKLKDEERDRDQLSKAFDTNVAAVSAPQSAGYNQTGRHH